MKDKMKKELIDEIEKVEYSLRDSYTEGGFQEPDMLSLKGWLRIWEFS